jgi:hypothetical protein
LVGFVGSRRVRFVWERKTGLESFLEMVKERERERER